MASTVNGWHAEHVDPATNADKFYAIYVLPDGTEMRRWGRRGAVGQFKQIDHHSVVAAQNSAQEQMHKKLNKGYQPSTNKPYGYYCFECFQPRIHDDRSRTSLANVADSALRSIRRDEATHAPTPEAAPSTPVQADGLAAFADRAMHAITLSVAQPEEGLVEFAKLQSEWGEIEETVQRARSYLDTLEELIS